MQLIKKLFSVLILLSLYSNSSICQERKDLGIQAGGSYYMGDYNQGTPLYKVSPSFGLIYRYNLNKYYSLRLSAGYGSLRGSYTAQNPYLPGATGSFSKHVIDLEGLCEINFMSFTTLRYKKDNFSPYVIIGVGGAYIGGNIIPKIPFGVGVKYCPASRVTLGLEWRLNKTFDDGIDNYHNVYDGSKAMFHNNDWFSFMGLTVTYRLFNNKFTCPAYQ